MKTFNELCEEFDQLVIKIYMKPVIKRIEETINKINSSEE